MIRQLALIAAYAAVYSLAAGAEAAVIASGQDNAAALFGARANIQAIDISPDGNHLVYITPGTGRTNIVAIADLASGTVKPIIRSNGDPERLNWCNFVASDRLICQISVMVNRTGVLIPFSRLVTFDIDGKNSKELGQKSSWFDSQIRQHDGSILDWLSGEDGYVLMARQYVPEAGKIGSLIVRTEEGLGVDRIDTRTLQSSRVEAPSKGADFYLSDGHGNVRMKGYRPDRGSTYQLSGQVEYSYRLPGSKEWKPFSTWRDMDRSGMAPIAVDATTNSAYVLQKLDGRNALYRVKLDGSMASELVYKNDRVDVDDVVRIGNGRRVIGATFVEEKRTVVYFDPEYQKLAAALAKAIPNLPKIEFYGSSTGDSKLLIFAGSDADPGRYFVYDKAKKTLAEAVTERPQLADIKLASVKPVTYPAADGTLVPSYLTLPPGKENAKGLPAVVLPHGGPSARDEWGFDWLAQFLAHEGYAVLQPNYRGSAGFGDAWLQQNGFKSWRTSIGDVTAAGKWLIGQGIADPDKLVILGWSYGGYAALQSAAIEPDLFKAVVAIAPVTDLGLVKDEAKDYTNARNVAEFIGSGPHISQGSPLQNAELIKAPVLMFHGDMDLNVHVEQSRKMDARLRSAGKQSELVVFEGLEYDLADSDARTQMLDKIATFLANAIGG